MGRLQAARPSRGEAWMPSIKSTVLPLRSWFDWRASCGSPVVGIAVQFIYPDELWQAIHSLRGSTE